MLFRRRPFDNSDYLRVSLLESKDTKRVTAKSHHTSLSFTINSMKHTCITLLLSILLLHIQNIHKSVLLLAKRQLLKKMSGS